MTNKEEYMNKEKILNIIEQILVELRARKEEIERSEKEWKFFRDRVE